MSSPDEDAGAVSTTQLLRTLMAELPLKQAVALTAQATGGSRNVLYTQALALRDGADPHGPDIGDEGDAPPSLPPTRLPTRPGRARR